MSIRLIAALLIVILATAASPGQTPLGTTFTYQGRLNQAGQPYNGNADFVFGLYDAAGGGNLLGSHALNGVGVSGGLFTVQLNGGGEFGPSAFSGEQRWLEISVNGTLLAPRQELTAAPNALFALDADRLDGLNSTAFLQSIPVPLTLSGTSNPHIIRAENAATNTNATGLWGLSTAASGATRGVYGQSDSTSGRGVVGLALAGTGETYGGYFQNNSTGANATGVFGWAIAQSGSTYGGRFENASSSGNAAGVFGYATAASGVTYGVWGQTASTSGRGVYGKATAATGPAYGGFFRSDSNNGIGVFGVATAASGAIYGVLGEAVNTLPAFAGPEYGVYATGDIGSSGQKTFRIDHPDDPANKYLLHYSTEGPEVINFYRGTVVLDGAGKAVVDLPHYFAKINKTPSYVLTAVGAPMPLLHVAAEIDEAALSVGEKAGPGEAAPRCSFRIAGGEPGAKVSWRVEAVRNDRWVQQRGAPVEVEKQGLEKGTYQHPDLYGQPAEKGMNYDAERASSLGEAVRQEQD